MHEDVPVEPGRRPVVPLGAPNSHEAGSPSPEAGVPAPPGPMVTIYDIAAEAGVAPSTVSRALSRPGRVSARTSQLVHETAARLGYRAEGVYHPPKPRRTRIIGLLTSDVTNPFYFGIIRGAEVAARTAGCSIMLIDAQEDENVERALIEDALPAIDALVVASSRVSDAALRAAGKQVPLAILNRDVSGLPCVLPDTRLGIEQALDLLVALGHQRVAYVSGPDSSWANGQRWRCLRDGCLARGLFHHRIGPVHPTVRGGEEAGALVTTRGGTAVVAYNDLVAIGVMRSLQRRGLRVPGDISVIGHDNTFASDLVSPGLTTVAAPLLHLGEQGVRAVLSASSPLRPIPEVVPTRLVVRESTGPAA